MKRKQRKRSGATTPAAPMSRRTPDPTARTSRAVLVWAAFTFVSATLVRYWFPAAWSEEASSSSAFYLGDTRAFLSFAAHLVDGRPFDNGVPFHPPGWPIVLALFYRLMGYAPLDGTPAAVPAIKLFMAIVSGLSVALGSVLAAMVAGRGAMLAAGALGVFHFGHTVQGGVPTSEPLYGLLLVCVLIVGLKVSRGGARAGLLGGGLALGGLAGLATLVRAEFALGAVLLAGVLWRNLASAAGRTLIVAVYLAAFAASLGPTTIAHWRSISGFNRDHADKLPGPLPRFAPVTSYGAFNFATANHDYADGGPNTDLPALEPADPSDETRLASGELDLAAPSVYAVYTTGYRMGLEWMTANPGRALALMGRKIGLTWGALSHGYTFENLPIGVDGERRRVDMLDPASGVLWPPHAVLLALGIWLTARDRRTLAVLLIPLATLAVSVLGFFGYVRVAVAYLPALWVFQGAALAAIGKRIRWPHAMVRRPMAAVAALMAGLLALEAARIGTPRSVQFTGLRGPDGSLMVDETLRITRVR